MTEEEREKVSRYCSHRSGLLTSGVYNPPSWPPVGFPNFPGDNKLDNAEYQGGSSHHVELNSKCAHNFVPSFPPSKDSNGNWVTYPALCSRCGKWSKEQ